MLQNLASSVQKVPSMLQNLASLVRNTVSGVQNTSSWVQDAASRVQQTSLWVQSTSSRVRNIGSMVCRSLPPDHHVAHHQQVHLRAQEAVERLGGSVDDRLVLVERGVQHERDAGG